MRDTENPTGGRLVPFALPGARRVPPETERVAACVRWLRADVAGLSRDDAGHFTGFPDHRIGAFEATRAGVPMLYAGRLLRVADVDAATFMDALFAAVDWPRDPRAFAPLPDDARALECTLRLWRTEPVAANASLRRLVESTLDNAPA
ncbi:hypothetical protein SAMN05216241_11418 [Limimonas halophila]|uniref:Uncharacterized protein n=1 Tax=Limimonas halophila TaxID=1082479 RepID=A0A1G7UFZ4_9PROT|nr:hypothetical protein [Limimonas halophila]SDG46238.1 hypothetical protein SAMN05216241_11418 [Limimonas halophila]